MQHHNLSKAWGAPLTTFYLQYQQNIPALFGSDHFMPSTEDRCLGVFAAAGGAIVDSG